MGYTERRGRAVEIESRNACPKSGARRSSTAKHTKPTEPGEYGRPSDLADH